MPIGAFFFSANLYKYRNVGRRNKEICGDYARQCGIERLPHCLQMTSNQFLRLAPKALFERTIYIFVSSCTECECFKNLVTALDCARFVFRRYKSERKSRRATKGTRFRLTIRRLKRSEYTTRYPSACRFDVLTCIMLNFSEISRTRELLTEELKANLE